MLHVESARAIQPTYRFTHRSTCASGQVWLGTCKPCWGLFLISAGAEAAAFLPVTPQPPALILAPPGNGFLLRLRPHEAVEPIPHILQSLAGRG